MEADTIERPSCLDTKFIEEALHSREEYDDVIVVDIRVQLAVGKGENYSCLLYRVGVEFKHRNIKDETKSTSLIKVSSAVEVFAKFLAENNVFEKETKIYQVTIPAMMHLLQQNFQGRKFQHLVPFGY
jgi:hypothetical protein